MKFGKKFLEAIGYVDTNDEDIYEYDDYQDGYYDTKETPALMAATEKKSSPFDRFRHNQSDEDVATKFGDDEMKVVLLQPMRFEEAQSIAKHLMDKKVVVFDLQECDVNEAVNIVNFVSGAVFALRGAIQKINERGAIFVAIPKEVELENELRGGFSDDDYGPTIAEWVNKTRNKGEI